MGPHQRTQPTCHRRLPCGTVAIYQFSKNARQTSTWRTSGSASLHLIFILIKRPPFLFYSRKSTRKHHPFLFCLLFSKLIIFYYKIYSSHNATESHGSTSVLSRFNIFICSFFSFFSLTPNHLFILSLFLAIFNLFLCYFVFIFICILECNLQHFIFSHA
jgi:hypothetical protein